jgi:hypothetical protein
VLTNDYIVRAFDDTFVGETVRYNRDEAGQLALAFYSLGTNRAAIRFVYDANGNRLLREDIALNDWSIDSQGTGLSDLWQLAYFGGLGHTGTEDPDSDGLVNSNEFAASGNPTLPDTDVDGQSDLEEFIAGTALNDPAAYFRVDQLYIGGGTSVVQWAGISNRGYQVQSCSTLSGLWTNGSGWIYPPTNGPIELENPAGSNLFYRICVTRP